MLADFFIWFGIIWIGIIGLAALVISIWIRAFGWFSPRVREPIGTPFDVSVVRPRIEDLRDNFAAEATLRKQDLLYHDELLERTRQAVSQLAFFQPCREASAPEHLKEV